MTRGRNWPSAEERFWPLVEKTDGCWTFMGSPKKKDYPDIGVDGRKVKVHVFAYQLLIGPVPVGFDVHHDCENKRCVNPDHLRPLTRSEHLRLHRGGKQTCRNGHSMANAYIAPLTGKRLCRVCRREYERERAQRMGHWPRRADVVKIALTEQRQ